MIMEYCANLGRKAQELNKAAVLEDLDLSSSDSGSDIEFPPGQGSTETGHPWRARDTNGENRPRPATTRAVFRGGRGGRSPPQ